MKRQLLLPLLGFFALNVHAQTEDMGGSPLSTTEAVPPFIIQSSADSVCPGDPVTLTVDVQEDELLALTSGGNSQNGVMFDVSATYGAIITGFEVYLNSGGTVEVYYKTGTHVGSETTPGNWTFLDSVHNVPSGSPVRPNLQFSQPILPGQTLAFYVTTTTGSMAYTNGTAVGNTLSSDSYLTIKQGVGKSYPFSGTYTPRSFNSSIFYERGISSVIWNSGGNTPQITVNPTKSRSYQASVEFTNNSISRDFYNIKVDDPRITLIATPPQVLPGQSTILSAEVEYHTGVFAEQKGGNGQNGAMFNITAQVPIIINSFSISPYDTTDIEIYYKTGSFVGSETNANDWTSLGSAQDILPGHDVDLPIPINLSIAGGQTMAFYITSSSGASIYYSNGSLTPGTTYLQTPFLSISEGIGKSYPFGSNFTPRRLNFVAQFEVDNPSQSAFQWSSGPTSGSIQVTPANSAYYSLSTTLGGCTAMDSLWVPVTAVGLEEWKDIRSFNLFPNPTQGFVNIDLVLNEIEDLKIELVNAVGQRVLKTHWSGFEFHERLDLTTLPAGLYYFSVQGREGSLSQPIVIQ